jgi:hypothetical protein
MYYQLTVTKKWIAFFCIFYLSFTNIHAQANKWSLGIGLGVASPIGKFGDTDIFDSASAFATTGPALNLQVDYKLNRYIGFSILLTGQQNTVDTKTMATKFQKSVYGAFFNISSGDWNIGKIMGGVSFSVQIDEKQKLNFSARIMAGVLKTTLPKITITEAYYSDSLGNVAISTFSKEKHPLNWTFAYLAGLGLRYNLSKNFFLLATVDYSASSPEVPYYPVGARAFAPGAYPITGSTVVIVLPNPASPKTFKQPINSLTFCLGTGINF